MGFLRVTLRNEHARLDVDRIKAQALTNVRQQHLVSWKLDKLQVRTF